MFHCNIWTCEHVAIITKPPCCFYFCLLRILSNCFSFPFLRHTKVIYFMKRNYCCAPKAARARAAEVSAHIPADKHTQTETSLASTCRQCGEEIRLHQMHNAVLISMPANLTQSKKVTLCRNQKAASLFQNCMLGSLQADRFSEWDSLKRNVFHLRLTTSCSRQNWKTILISDHCNGSDTSVWEFFFPFLFRKLVQARSHAWQKYTHYTLVLVCWCGSNSVSPMPSLASSICSLCPSLRFSQTQ